MKNQMSLYSDMTIHFSFGMKKAISLLLTLIMLLSTVIPLTATEGDVCYIGDNAEVTYASLTAAINAATAGDTIHLISDASLGNEDGTSWSTGKSVCIDGKNPKGDNFVVKLNSRIQIMHADDFALENVTVKLNGKHFWVVEAEDKKSTKLTLKDGCVLDGENTERVGSAGAIELSKTGGSAEVVMESGSVIKNAVAKNNGGAVFVNGGTLTVNDGVVIKDCKSNEGKGGAIHLEKETSKLLLNGGTIENCCANLGGGAIYVNKGSLELKGDVTVTGNKVNGALNNIHLTGDAEFTLTDDLTGRVGVTASEATEGEAFGSIKNGAQGAQNIISDRKAEVFAKEKNGKLYFVEDYVCYIGDSEESGKCYVSLSKAMLEAKGGTIHLMKDASLSIESGENFDGLNGAVIDGAKGNGENYTISLTGYLKFINSGEIKFTNVTIDLNKNGFGLYRPDSSKKCIFTLGDGTTVKNGLNTNGGAAQITSGAELIMKDGSLVTECEAGNVGGAFIVHGGTLTLEGGKITGNKAGTNGGGVWVQADGCVKIKGKSEISDNKIGEKDNNIGLNVNSGVFNSSFILDGDFYGTAGVNFDGAAVGKSFGEATEGVKGAYNIKLDGFDGVYGCVSDGKITAVKGKLEASTSIDAGVKKAFDESILSGTIRYITNIEKCEGADITAYGTYIMPKSVYDEAEAEILKHAGEVYKEYLVEAKSTDEDFVSLSSLKSYGVDLTEIPVSVFGDAFEALSFVKIGDATVILKHKSAKLSDIGDGETGEIKDVGSLKETHSLSELKYRDPNEIYLTDEENEKTVNNIVSVKQADLLGTEGEEITLLTDGKASPVFVPEKQYIIYRFSQLTGVSGIRTIKASGCEEIEKSIIYGSTDSNEWFEVGTLFGADEGTCITDFGFNIKLLYIAVSVDSDEKADIKLSDMHILGENEEYALIDESKIEAFKIYTDGSSYKVSADTEHKDKPASNLFDGDYDTFWHSDYETVGNNAGPTKKLPHTVTVDFGKEKIISGLRYIPRNGPNKITRAKVYGTTDGKNYYLMGESEKWSYSDNSDTTPREILFGANYAVKGIRFVSVEGQGADFSTGAEIELYKRNMGYRDSLSVDEITLSQREKISVKADGNISDAWDLSEKTSWKCDKTLPIVVEFNFTEAMSISGIRYTSEEETVIEEADIYISEDGVNYKKYCTASFKNDYTYLFRCNFKLKALRLEIKKSNKSLISINEFKLLTECNELNDISLFDEMEKGESWSAKSESEVTGREADKIIDGNIDTFWHSYYDGVSGVKDNLPIDLTIDFGEKTKIGGFNYYPRRDNAAGYFKKADVYVSLGTDENGEDVWEKAVSVSYDYPSAYMVQKTEFPFNYVTDKVKLHVTEGNGGYATGSEIRFLMPTDGKDPISAEITPSEIVFEHDDAKDVRISINMNDAKGIRAFSYNGSPVNSVYYSIDSDGILLSKYFFEDIDRVSEPHDADFEVEFWIGEMKKFKVKVGGTERYKVNFYGATEGGALSAKAVTASGAERSLSSGDTVRKTETLIVEAMSDNGYKVSDWSVENLNEVYEKITDRTLWTVTASSTRNEEETACMIDGKEDTYWHSGYTVVNGAPQAVEEKDKKPFYITLTFPQKTELAGFYYLPRQDSTAGKITEYEIYSSTDGAAFDTLISKGTVSYSEPADLGEKEIKFGKTVKVDKIQIKILATSGNWGQIAELYGMRVKDSVKGKTINKGTVYEALSFDGLYTDIAVKASFERLADNATVSYELLNISAEGPRTAEKGTDVTVSFSDKDNYYMPKDVKVYQGEALLIKDKDYTYTRSSDKSATLVIKNVSGNITVKAEGADHDTHSVAYKEEFGALGSVPETEIIGAGRKVTVKAGNIKLQGYTFKGWKMLCEGITEEKTLKVGDTFVMPNADVILTAVWEKTSSGVGSSASKPSGTGGSSSKPSGGSVIGGGSVGSVTVNIEGVGSVTLIKGATVSDAPDKEGYEFIGYYLDEGLSVPYNNTGVNGALTLYPCYRRIRSRSELVDMTNHWAKDFVGELYEAYLIDGRGEGEFAPDAVITRAEFCRMLYLVSGKASDGINYFDDVASGDWFGQAVSWAYENEIVMGTSDKTFSPNEPITREQMAVMLYRYAVNNGVGWEIAERYGFADDESISDYALYQISWAVEKGIAKGYENGSFKPKGNATRAEAAVMLLRLKNLI